MKKITALNILKEIEFSSPMVAAEAILELFNQSTPITREALTERGFTQTTGNWVEIKKGYCSVIVCNDTLEVCVCERDNMVTVPNCKTMEDIDKLINLFIA